MKVIGVRDIPITTFNPEKVNRQEGHSFTHVVTFPNFFLFYLIDNYY